MLRYIKVNGQWIDTLEALKTGITYLVIDGDVIIIYTDRDEYVGKLQGERDL